MIDEPLRVRAPMVRIVDHGTTTTVIGAQAARRFDGDSAALLRSILEIHARPVGRAQLLAELAARAGTEASVQLPTESIDQPVALRVADRVLVAASAPPRSTAACSHLAARTLGGRRATVRAIAPSRPSLALVTSPMLHSEDSHRWHGRRCADTVNHGSAPPACDP